MNRFNRFADAVAQGLGWVVGIVAGLALTKLMGVWPL